MPAPSLQTVQLATDLQTVVLPPLEIPFTETLIENATDVQTLDYNVYTDFISTKRVWTMSWKYMDSATYNELRTIYNSQFTLYKYPLLSIPFYDLVDIPVRMTINEKNVANVAGGVEDITITLRETAQQA